MGHFSMARVVYSSVTVDSVRSPLAGGACPMPSRAGCVGAAPQRIHLDRSRDAGHAGKGVAAVRAIGVGGGAVLAYREPPNSRYTYWPLTRLPSQTQDGCRSSIGT